MSNKPQVTSVDQYNPVDYYNKFFIQEQFDMMEEIKCVKKIGINALSYVLNKSDETKRMIVLDKGFFICEIENKLGLSVGLKYTPFQLLQRFFFKGSFHAACFYVAHYLMGIESQYIRVGVDYCKVITSIDNFGVEREEVKQWNKGTIVDDYGKQALAAIPKFDSFTLVPDNKEHNKAVNNKYNVYAKFSHTPMDKKDYEGSNQWKWTKKFFKHIFGDQYQMGLKYIKVLYDKPKQTLPILALVSEERQTGKSTFIEYITAFFGDNAMLAGNQTLKSQFNSSYATKNIMCIEEALLEKKQEAEKLKALSTQKTINVNQKNISEYTAPVFLKIIIASNNVKNFVRIDDDEIRYWVREVPAFEKGSGNHNILNDMIAEIPAFLCFLNSLPDVDTSRSRMVFTEEELITDALKNVKDESVSNLKKDMEIYIDEFLMDNEALDILFFSAGDVKEAFFRNNSQVGVRYISTVLKDEMKLAVSRKRRYTNSLVQQHEANNKNGTPFHIPNPYYNPKIKR